MSLLEGDYFNTWCDERGEKERSGRKVCLTGEVEDPPHSVFLHNKQHRRCQARWEARQVRAHFYHCTECWDQTHGRWWPAVSDLLWNIVNMASSQCMQSISLDLKDCQANWALCIYKLWEDLRWALALVRLVEVQLLCSVCMQCELPLHTWALAIHIGFTTVHESDLSWVPHLSPWPSLACYRFICTGKRPKTADIFHFIWNCSDSVLVLTPGVCLRSQDHSVCAGT